MASLVELQELFNSLFIYELDTGLLYRKTTGRPVGVVDGVYLSLNVGGRGGKKFWVHRVIWIMMTGTAPKHIDHINGKGRDNRWTNLRASNAKLNQANNHKVIRGVEAHGQKYRARIKVDQKRIELGSFNTFEEAQSAYNKAADKYFGEHARCNRPH